MSCAGCNDTALPLTNCNDGCEDCQPTHAVGLPDCPPNSESCEEIHLANCLKYVGPNLPTLGVTNGMRLNVALAAINYYLTPVKVYKNHTITVTPVQTKTTVQYVDKFGVLQIVIVSPSSNVTTICALEGTVTKMSGSGTIAATTTNC